MTVNKIVKIKEIWKNFDNSKKASFKLIWNEKDSRLRYALFWCQKKKTFRYPKN